MFKKNLEKLIKETKDRAYAAWRNHHPDVYRKLDHEVIIYQNILNCLESEELDEKSNIGRAEECCDSE
jgi:hypothetical protein